MTPTPIWKHFAAFFYDLFPVLGILLLTNLMFLFFRNGVEIPAHTLWFQLIIFFEIFFYYAYSWKAGGQTLGMRAWKIKIQQLDKKQINYYSASIRFFVGLLSTALAGIGLFWKLVDRDKKSWMDKASQSETINTN